LFLFVGAQLIAPEVRRSTHTGLDKSSPYNDNFNIASQVVLIIPRYNPALSSQG
jgi:hypothetical protein